MHSSQRECEGVECSSMDVEPLPRASGTLSAVPVSEQLAESSGSRKLVSKSYMPPELMRRIARCTMWMSSS